MIVVTGAAGFIGSNIIAALNRTSVTDIVAVDQVAVEESANLSSLKFSDYWSADDFLVRLRDRRLARSIEVVFHEGGCSSTVERDEELMLNNNYRYSQDLLSHCLSHGIVCQYASSAGVYGSHRDNRELPQNETPLTVYARSKLMIDNYLRTISDKHYLTGLRYFNVYGQGEGHKGFMRSTPLIFDQQLKESGCIRVFGANDACAAGAHSRDFIHIDDVVAVKLWMAEHSHPGIYNVGTGRARTFLEIAQLVVSHHGYGKIEYTPFPEDLKPYYQNYTEAQLDQLRAIGYKGAFMPIEEGIPRYLRYLAE